MEMDSIRQIIIIVIVMSEAIIVKIAIFSLIIPVDGVSQVAVSTLSIMCVIIDFHTNYQTKRHFIHCRVRPIVIIQMRIITGRIIYSVLAFTSIYFTSPDSSSHGV